MKLKLFVWEDVLYDWSAGVMFALAETVKEARELILKECHYVVKEDLAKEPKVVTEKEAFVIWGGS